MQRQKKAKAPAEDAICRSADHADRGVGPTLQHPWHKPALATCRSQCWPPRCSLLAARCWLFRAAIEPSRHMHRGHGGSVSDQQAGNCLAHALTDMNFKGKHDRTATHTHGAHTTTIVLSVFCLGVVYVRTYVSKRTNDSWNQWKENRHTYVRTYVAMPYHCATASRKLFRRESPPSTMT